uniref:Ecdysteroid kinase n=1 Tax=Musca domestica TaxID=7370 RepID=T1PKH9_MUSDO
MGLINTKRSSRSYDIAPIVSDKEFRYKKAARPLPDIAVPQVIITPDADKELETENKTNQSTMNSSRNSPAIPTWINMNIFQELLPNIQSEFLEILSFQARPALAPGENYCTLMLKITIIMRLKNNSNETLSFMMKVAHDSSEMAELLEMKNFFDVEREVYSKVIPEMEEMYRQAGGNVSFGAKVYELSDAVPTSNYVLLEDLCVRGYRNVNRLKCLDMDHTEAVLRKLAKFHAASACRIAERGSYSDILQADLSRPQGREYIVQMFNSFRQPFMENLRLYENGEKYYESMNKFFDNVVDEFIYGRLENPAYFNALNHGDVWCNNILFKHNADGKVEDALFVDFQNTNYGPVAQDLFYFIISSTQIDIKIDEFDYFIRYYHQHLEESLRLLKYPAEKIPTLRELHQQLIFYGSWAIITSFFTMGIVLLDPSEKANFENMLGEQKDNLEFKKTIYSNPRYVEHITKLLPWFHARGFMETRDWSNEGS